MVGAGIEPPFRDGDEPPQFVPTQITMDGGPHALTATGGHADFILEDMGFHLPFMHGDVVRADAASRQFRQINIHGGLLHPWPQHGDAVQQLQVGSRLSMELQFALVSGGVHE